jgi:hypothetical protein
MEYGATIWNPYLKGDIDKLEKIQNRTICFIKRDYRSREKGVYNENEKRTRARNTGRKTTKPPSHFNVQGGRGVGVCSTNRRFCHI